MPVNVWRLEGSITARRYCHRGGRARGSHHGAGVAGGEGVPFDVYERNPDVRRRHLGPRSRRGTPMYETAHFYFLEMVLHYFYGFPFPEDYPDYPSNGQILDYIRGSRGPSTSIATSRSAPYWK